jgi:hypothetical protein
VRLEVLGNVLPPTVPPPSKGRIIGVVASDISAANILAAGSDRGVTMDIGCLSVQSFPMQLFETADVSLVEGTISGCNYSFFFTSPRNGIEETGGPIPFSSTKALGLIFLKGGLKRFELESIQDEAAILPPSSTVSTRRWRAPAIALGFGSGRPSSRTTRIIQSSETTKLCALVSASAIASASPAGSLVERTLLGPDDAREGCS